MTEEEKKYREEQRKRMKGYVVGGKDTMNNTITKIFSRGDEYMVYEIKTKVLSDSIKVLVDTEAEHNKVPIERFDEIRPNFSKIKGLLYKVNDDTSIKTRIAHIVSHGLSGKTDEANKQFDALINEVNKEYSNQFNHRLRYLVTILSITILEIICSIFVYAFKLFENEPELKNLVYVVTGGSIGGFLSVGRRLRKTIFEKDVKAWSYIVYGIERVFISIFGAVIVYFALRSNLIFGIVNELPRPIFGCFVFAVVAGFSETLVPNLLIKMEREAEI